MRKFWGGIAVAAALVALVGVVHARSAGTKPAARTPVVAGDSDITGSVKTKTDSTDRDITGSIKKPKVHHRKSHE
jgi:hypothetical protein